ncbi:hypothetical protein DC31_13900 [Microbacterium sp. CH12i]|uniref:hypothetical protein n=1 Tax=Microbacterium sp. CH12i TaxID=1479651 RepID=UPI000461EEAB|nr:hypothetical protein [Microbacterium sp. CH12i]KDA05560.1 hypothetical protein DC31_13900 [Microbacterium sp. CH12i]
MARSGNTEVEFNERFFETVLRQSKVEALVDGIGNKALSNARASAPVDDGDYRDGLHLEHYESRYRRTTRIVGDDDKTLLLESKGGYLARALKAAKQ